MERRERVYRMRISACYIVKDEAEELRRSLASVRAVVDEIIVVSTAGSSAVRDVCAAFSAEVHDFAWVNDFSLARNKALRYVTGNIVIFLDADEYFFCTRIKCVERSQRLHMGISNGTSSWSVYTVIGVPLGKMPIMRDPRVFFECRGCTTRE